VVLFAAEFARRWFGTGGLLASAAVLGLTDVDALTISMAKMPAIDPEVAARAIALGVLVNCALKATVAVALGTPLFARAVAATLTVMVLAIAASMGALR
jgi:uncharacterized membrane protein (DUF4010 family)